MINEALLNMLKKPPEIKENSQKSPIDELDKFAEEFNKYIEKEGIEKVALNIPKPTIPVMATLLSAGAGLTALFDYITQKREKSKGKETRSLVLDHIKALYPKKEHAYVEEAFASLSHIAPYVAQDPLISRTIIKNMMQQMTRPDLQMKGYGQVGIDTVTSAGKLEETKRRSKKESPATFAQILTERMRGAKEEIGMYEKTFPRPPKEVK